MHKISERPKMKLQLLRFSSVCLLVLCIVSELVQSMPTPQIEKPKVDDTETGKLFEGDILLKEGEKPYGTRRKREIILSSSGQEAQIAAQNSDFTHTWPNRTVYYTFENLLPEYYRSLFTEAMEEWSAHTCINFVLAQEGQDHILFLKSEELGCSSYVGRKGGPQIVSMSDFCCSKGHAIHEIGHAIGLWHEHSRPDRDTFIEVLFNNIIETEQDNFGKLDSEKFNLVPDVGYDIESIMHYGPYAFSKESSSPDQPTIRLREDAPLDYKNCLNLLSMGQRDQLSYLDILRVNKLYSCTAELAALENEGRACLTPVTTPTTTTAVPSTTMPSPTTTQAIPTPSPPKRLRSRSIITLRLQDNSDSEVEGVKCTPTCRSTRCLTYGSISLCNGIDYQFEIIVAEDPSAKKVRSGDTVALRSKSNPTQWLDCSDADSACSISRCYRNDADFISDNASTLTTCDAHFFKIFGVNRRVGKLLNENHDIQLRHEWNNSYLNCNIDNKCKLSDSTSPSFDVQVIS